MDGVIVSQPGEVADHFAREYSRRSNGISSDNLFNEHRTKEEKDKIAFPIVDPRKSYNRPFTIEELSYSLRKSSSKAPGPENIPTRFIKEIPLSKLPSLLAFYSYIWENGFPHQWRTAVVIPILKVSKPVWWLVSPCLIWQGLYFI